MPGERSTDVPTSELRRLAGLAWLPPAKLGLLSKHMTGLRLRRGEVLYRPGQPAKHIYCVLDGTIGLPLLGTDGRFVELGLLAAGAAGERGQGSSRLPCRTSRRRDLRLQGVGPALGGPCGADKDAAQTSISRVPTAIAVSGGAAPRPAGASALGVETTARPAAVDVDSGGTRRHGGGLAPAGVLGAQTPGRRRTFCSRGQADPAAGQTFTCVSGTEIRVPLVIGAICLVPGAVGASVLRQPRR